MDVIDYRGEGGPPDIIPFGIVAYRRWTGNAKVYAGVDDERSTQ